MAEIAEQQLQEMVTEFEELERLGFLNPDEVKELIRRRRMHEYRLCKRKKELKDFFEYVIYETNLLELLALRREKILQTKRFHQVENTICRRLVKKLHLMTSLWPARPDVWNFRLSFAKARCLWEEVSTIYAERIRFRGDDENVWVSWAQWEMEERKNFEKARQILLSRAPVDHKKSKFIKREYFRLELQYVKNLKEDSEQAKEILSEINKENRDKIMQCAIPEIVFQCSLKNFNCAELCQELFWIAHEFTFAHRLRDKIFREMVNTFPKDIYLWNLKAQLLLKGFILDETKLDTVDDNETNSDEESEAAEYSSVIVIKASTYTSKEKITALFKLYDEALSVVGPAYLESALIGLLKTLNETWPSEEFRSLIINKIIDIFETSSSDLEKKHFLFWYELAVEEKYEEHKLKNILELGANKFPDCQFLKLSLLPLTSKDCNLKGKKKIIASLSGKAGAEACWKLIMDSEVNLQEVLLEKAFDHTDSVIARFVRVKHLENLEDINEARKHYNEFRRTPPLSETFHITMLIKELKQPSICRKSTRRVFETVKEDFGYDQIGIWLSYLEFERKYGSMRNFIVVKSEVPKILHPKYMNDFNENAVYFETFYGKAITETEFHIVDSEAEVDERRYEFWSRSSLPNLLPQEAVISSLLELHRKRFFDKLAQIERQYSDLKQINEKEDCTILWEKMLSSFWGRKIVLNTKQIQLKEVGVDKDIEDFIKRIEKIGKKSNNKASASSFSSLNKETKKLLESSEILKPEFHTQKQIIPYYLSRNATKRFTKKEKAKDKGKGWFNMKAPEITEEVQKDLEVLKMRSVLDPHKHYKRSDMKEVPKYFQLGKVLDSPLDFFSSRIPKKQRKRTMAEEIVNSEEVLRYQKRKCSQILEAKKRKTMKRKKANKEERKVKKRKTEKS